MLYFVVVEHEKQLSDFGHSCLFFLLVYVAGVSTSTESITLLHYIRIRGLLLPPARLEARDKFYH
jgi:hypothetical protein